MEYPYTKTNVNLETLTFEINQSSIITTSLDSITFKEPNDLKIKFADTLSSAEETELDSIATAHSGQVLKHYRLYCNICTDYRSLRLPTSPTECPFCEDTDITNIVEQSPYVITMDELENKWEMFLVSDGTIISARRY